MHMKQYLAGAVVGAVVSAVLLLLGGMMMTAWEKESAHRLLFTGAAHRVTMDTRYVPLLGWTFSSRGVQYQKIAIINDGDESQENVQVIVTNAGKVAYVRLDDRFQTQREDGLRLADCTSHPSPVVHRWIDEVAEVDAAPAVAHAPPFPFADARGACVCARRYVEE